MPRRPLRCGLDLTRVGVDVGPHAAHAAADSGALAGCIHAATATGINWIDVGPGPELQTAVGKVLAGEPGGSSPVIVATLTGDDGEPASPGEFAATARATRDRLRVPTVDILLIDRRTASVEGAWEELVELRRGGAVGIVGLREPTVDAVEECHARGGVDVVCVSAGIDHRGPLGDILAWCVSNGIDVLARALIPHPRSRAVRQALRSAEMRHGNPADVALVAWVLAWPGVTAVAFPAEDAEEVDRRADAAQLKLARADLDAIASALRADGGDDDGFTRPGVRG